MIIHFKYDFNKDNKLGELLRLLNYSLEEDVEGHSESHGITLLGLNLDFPSNNKIHTEKTHIMFFDCLENFRGFNANSERYHISYLPIISIFDNRSQNNITPLSKTLESLVMPVFKFNIGIQGIGESFSFLVDNDEKWCTSQYLTTVQALANRLYASSKRLADYKISSKFFNEALDNVFTNNQKIDQNVLPPLNFPSRTNSSNLPSSSISRTLSMSSSSTKILIKNEQKMNLSILARYFLDSSEEMMTTACDLMTVAADYKKIDFVYIVQNPLDLLRLSLQYIQLTKFTYLSKCEVIWLLMIGYSSLNYENGMQLSRMCLNRISKVLEYETIV